MTNKTPAGTPIATKGATSRIPVRIPKTDNDKPIAGKASTGKIPTQLDNDGRYEPGVQLRIFRHDKTPYPFGGDYGESPRDETVWPAEDEPFDFLAFARTNPPYGGGPASDEEHTFTITKRLTRRSFWTGHGGAHVLKDYYDGDKNNICAIKVYDGIDFPFDPETCKECCNPDGMELADKAYAMETLAYGFLDELSDNELDGIVPKYYGSWTFPLAAPDGLAANR
ncbi:hypothetical protein B0T24DRAFT_684957 [Lasiosphaeria ovina]|uniref:Uncharacterized protein n=1 Tax=Lasiosphaeria ovina TaxID=92902 RepID=A0AAE0JTI5_9PEZI|nr:hypothetical protein B0T24DRAFT_684957 [Lasiosphaeria ovina]